MATGQNFPDALAGGVAAARQGGPILLVEGSTLPVVTANELARLRPQRIVVLGGPGAVTDGVLAALQPYAVGGGVTRLAGPHRHATAVAISQATTQADAPGTVFIATGVAFPDGLAGTPAAARAGSPVADGQSRHAASRSRGRAPPAEPDTDRRAWRDRRDLERGGRPDRGDLELTASPLGRGRLAIGWLPVESAAT